MTPPTPAAFAPLHDELIREAHITLADAMSRLELPLQGAAEDAAAARHEAIELAVVAVELLHRAEQAAAGIHESWQ